MAALELSGVSLAFSGSGGLIAALEGFSITVEDGEPVAVIGPSGCGKTTLLMLAAGLLRPHAGRVLVHGKPLAAVRRGTALILQDQGLLPWKTVLENAALGLRIRGVGRGEARRIAGSALERVGLADFAAAFPAELSGGMRQRVALARAIALDADMLLMDEPLTALDALTREDMQGVLLDLWKDRGHAQVLVTHSIEEAVFLGRRIFVMTPRPGRVASVVENPEMGSAGHRASAAFHRRCDELRALLAQEGALHPYDDAREASA